MKKSRLIGIIAVVVAAAIAIQIPFVIGAVKQKKASVKTPTLFSKVLDDHGFVYGINYVDVGLGDRQYSGVKANFNAKSVADGLYNVKQIGIDSAQIWLFSRTAGLVYDESGDIIGVQDKFLENLRTLCEIAKELDIYLAFTIQPHFDYTLESGVYDGSKEIYDRYTRFITDPAVRKNYIEKAVNPTLNVLKDYPEIVFGITAYCEPEGDIYGKENGYLPWGTSLDTMTDFLDAVVKESRKVLPNVPVSVASGWDYGDSVQHFSELDLDYIGMDIYSDDATVQDLSKFTLSSPAILSEFGPSGKASSTNYFFHMTNYQQFIANAKLGGYLGAYYWVYSGIGTMMSVLGSSEYDYTPMASTIHYAIVDDKNQQKGIEDAKDTAIMLAPDIDGTLKFIAARDAETYTFERSADKTQWTDAGSITANEAHPDTQIGSYIDQGAEEGKAYYYRITAEYSDGEKTVSEVSKLVTTMKTTCPENENLFSDYSFENTTLPHGFDWVAGNINEHWSMVSSADGSPVHSGNKALRVDGGSGFASVARDIKNIEKNKKYVLSFYVYADGGDGYMQCKVLDRWHAEFFKFAVSPSTAGKWVRYTRIVDIGDRDTISIGFTDVGGNFIIDDIYLFPYIEE